MARGIQRTALVVALTHLAALAALLALSTPRPNTPPKALRVQVTSLAPAAPSAAPTAPTKALSSRSAPARTEPSPALTSPELPTASAPPPASPSSDTSGDTQPSTARSGLVSPSPQASVPSVSGDREPVIDASFRGNPLPIYPSLSRRLGEQGTVTLQVLITAEGRAAEIRIEKSSGSARLDQAAVAAIREWRFVPALRGGKAVSAWFEWKWQFRLDD